MLCLNGSNLSASGRYKNAVANSIVGRRKWLSLTISLCKYFGQGTQRVATLTYICIVDNGFHSALDRWSWYVIHAVFLYLNALKLIGFTFVTYCVL